MKDYASGEELIAEIRKRAELFIAEFDDVPASELHTLKDGVDRTPAQMLAYQLGWMDLLLGWERDEQSGREVVTPAPGYRWNRLGDLYDSFDEQWRNTSLPRFQEAFRNRVDDVVALVTSLSREELFTSGQRAWASSTPSAWPTGPRTTSRSSPAGRPSASSSPGPWCAPQSCSSSMSPWPVSTVPAVSPWPRSSGGCARRG